MSCDRNNVGNGEDSSEAFQFQEGDVDCSSAGMELLPITANSTSNSKFRNAAILVRGGCKKYGSKKSGTVVLENFNMTVNQGTIYGLLGASGCGKTTLLSCVVGLRQMEKGEILIHGAAPGTKQSGVPGKRVGYMPQEVALYGEFTIAEAIQYFGRMFGMSTAQIKEKIDFLVGFLNLPPSNRKIGTLSGGQQRRVSFAVSLAHDPEILILDEPTVGVDPLLRKSIWNHLCKIVDQKSTTILITTHYIEEARQANRIGIMRSGKLLAEDSPLNLLNRYNCVLLEDIVLKLSEIDELNIENAQQPSIQSNQANNLQSIKSEKSDRNNSVDACRSPRKFFERRKSDAKSSQPLLKPYVQNTSVIDRLRSLTIKNFIMFFRNLWFVSFVLLLPALQVAVVCTAIGLDPQNINIGVVNKEIQNASNCQPPKGCTLSRLSCRYLNVLPKDSVILKPLQSEEEAMRESKEGNIWGFISFPEDFSTHMYERALTGSLAENETMYGARFKVQLDMSNKQIGQMMKKIFIEAFRTFSTKLMTDCDIDPTGRDLPLYFGEPIYGTEDTSYREFIAPSVSVGCVYFFTLCSCGLVYISEKREGMLERSLVAGVGTMEIMLSHLFTQFFVLLGQILLVFIVLVPIFSISIKGPVVWVSVLIVLVGCSGMSLGFLVSTICNEEKHAIQLAMALFFPNFLLSGMLWPVEAMPLYLQYFAYTLPCTLAGESMRSIFTRGWGIAHTHVWPGFVVTLAWTAIYWIITICVHSFNKRRR